MHFFENRICDNSCMAHGMKLIDINKVASDENSYPVCERLTSILYAPTEGKIMY